MNLHNLSHFEYKKWFRKATELFVSPQPATAQRDWQILLIVASVCFVLLAAHALYFFFAVDRETLREQKEEETSAVQSLDRSELDDALERLDARTKAFDALKSNSPSIVDPSR